MTYSSTRGKPVMQLTTTGKPIRVFPSITSAIEATGISRSVINRILKGEVRESDEFYWREQPKPKPVAKMCSSTEAPNPKVVKIQTLTKAPGPCKSKPREVKLIALETPIDCHPQKVKARKATKMEVWDKHIGIKIGSIKCPYCHVNEINQFNVHCGHVKAKSRGGKMTAENLRPICAVCNHSMGVEPLDLSKYRITY